MEWADSRVALEVRARECLARVWEVREVPCSREVECREVECREVECREVEWVLVDLRSVSSFRLHCLFDNQQSEHAVLSCLVLPVWSHQYSIVHMN